VNKSEGNLECATSVKQVISANWLERSCVENAWQPHI